MLDIARHYYSCDDIKQIIDALSLLKMNVLHLHLSDDESFAYLSKYEIET